MGREELRRGQQDRVLERADGSLVGRVEGAERVDLVAEELDPDRQRGGWREDVDDSTAPGELAAAGDLRRRRVAEGKQLPQERLRPQPATDPQAARLVGQVIGRDRVLEEGLDARDEDPGVPAPPGRQRRDPRGGLVSDELAPLVRERGPRLEDDDRRRIAEPRRELLRDAISDLGIPSNPGETLAVLDPGEGRREERLGAVGDRAQPDVASDTPAGRGGRRRREPGAQVGERARCGEQRRQR